jgi:hypothetical protein
MFYCAVASDTVLVWAIPPVFPRAKRAAPFLLNACRSEFHTEASSSGRASAKVGIASDTASAVRKDRPPKRPFEPRQRRDGSESDPQLMGALSTAPSGDAAFAAHDRNALAAAVFE